ncbi:dihydrodipicolinate synthetase family protein [Ascobolus immersus RN42]|uniref:Dihydrodipicolinate synthetase family protein n=1 Tax=Ascobolus immersus RN42 TaxID=1160509 RepID=A0A3N4IQ25_ASCIM|nr:dihydrodipicolinate synthetase family protein [Ascobolus immersus RN42]
MSSSTNRVLVPGVYAPTVAFFTENEDIDIPTTGSHAVRLADAGIKAFLVQGSNGEAAHLTHEDRDIITKSTREALDRAGFSDIPVIAGCGAQSIRESIQLCQKAHAAGADYAMILPPSYYKSLYTHDSIIKFFLEIAASSPIPIFIYNFPAAVNGFDLNSDDILRLSEHPNIVGCKLTCGNTGKLCRVAASARPGFFTMGGSADFALQTLIVCGQGVIAGLANIAPRACSEIQNLFNKGRLMEAQKLQAIVARGDWAAIQSGAVGTKAALNAYYGYGGVCRKPLPVPTHQEAERWNKGFEELVIMERYLETGSKPIEL